jgi:hypothetical protein
MQQPGQIDPKSSRHSEVQVDCRNESQSAVIQIFNYSNSWRWQNTKYTCMYVGFWITHITIVGRGNNILKLLASKDVNRHKMTLGMAMLSGLGGRHLHNLSNKTVCHMKRKRGNEGHPAAWLLGRTTKTMSSFLSKESIQRMASPCTALS